MPKTQLCFLRFRTLIFVSVVTTEKGVKRVKSQKRFFCALYRFSKEAKNVAEESQEIDWQELITLAKAAIGKEERSRCSYSGFLSLLA